MNKETKIIAEPGKQELFIEREFDAPRELVFRAFTEPELIEQWQSPRKMNCKVDKHAKKEGEGWRMTYTDSNGNEFAFNGVVHEITAPERVIRTFEFEGLPEKGHVSLEILTLETLSDSRTKIVIQSVFRSIEDRDGMIQSGMEKGVVESHERLDELLEKDYS